MQKTWDTRVWSWGRPNPLEKDMPTHSTILAWTIHGQRSPVGDGPRGRKESDRTEHVCTHGVVLICNKKNCISEHNHFDMSGFADCHAAYRPGLLRGGLFCIWKWACYETTYTLCLLVAMPAPVQVSHHLLQLFTLCDYCLFIVIICVTVSSSKKWW